jgi:hypothetical protein
MKNISIYILSFLFVGVSFGQGNLQFNQVKLVGTTSETVPAGKVWKIESAPLTVKNGIRVPPTFSIGTDTIILGYDSYSTSVLENVVSVKVEWKGNNFGPMPSCLNGYGGNSFCNGSINLKLNVGGVSTGSNILEESLVFQNIPNISSSNYISLGTVNLVNKASNFLSSWSLDFSPVSVLFQSGGVSTDFWGVDYFFRITFLLTNGNAVSYLVSKNQSACGSNALVSIQGPSVATETRTRPQVTTQFPIWIPAGTSVKTLSNIAKLSILEFNVTQ